MDKNLTATQLYSICQKHRFILVRYARDKDMIGINCGIGQMSKFKNQKDNDTESNFLSYSPCSFQEYISKKQPFIIQS